MAKPDKKVTIPKRIFGFKLSKGTRKDLRKLIGLLEHPEARTLELSAATALAAYLGEKTLEGKGSLGRIGRKATKMMDPPAPPAGTH